MKIARILFHLHTVGLKGRLRKLFAISPKVYQVDVTASKLHFDNLMRRVASLAERTNVQTVHSKYYPNTPCTQP